MSDSNINVAVKMRPLIKREIDKKIPACWRNLGTGLVDTVTGANEFSFELIFDENSTTTELYDKVARPIVSTALAGVNGTVFAYGQTSSGKTHTMMGDENNDGLMMMAIKHIFSEVQSSNIEFVIRVGFIEIYNEKVYDLYDPDNTDLKMFEKNNDAYVNCKEAICKCVDDMYNVIKIGNKNKKIGDTDMNDRSSRSHTIFRISIESIDAVSEKAKISNLNLVDLAGSERASQTGATGTRFVEGAHINKSLLSLSKVINKLINNENFHLNYRDSKLTRYLQSSLGGNAMAAIICTICPTTLDETISTLYFAQRAMKVTNKPRVNEIISDATMIKQLHNQIKTLKVELEKAKSEANVTNSAVPRIMQELSLHQGNILNYRKAETKSKLRRRTWTTFDNELAVISETKPLMLTTQQCSMTDLSAPDPIVPNLQMVTRDRGIGSADYDATPDFDKMTEEFDYKSKYERLLFEFEELQEFTNWENKFHIEPDVVAEHKAQVSGLEAEIAALHEERDQLRHELEAAQSHQCETDPTAENEFKSQISSLEAEIGALQKEHSKMRYELGVAQQEKESTQYLYEQHVKKAEQREKDLLEMCEDLKKGQLVNNAIEEKNFFIEQLQEQMKELHAANDELTKKIQEHGDVEQRVAKLERVEVELEELKNTITVLTNTILTLETEKKEMSIRFNESMSASAFEMTQSVSTAPSSTQAIVSVNMEEEIVSVGDCGGRTSTSGAEVSKLQSENDELSMKVMELIEENDDLKQRAEDLVAKLNEMEAKEAEFRTVTQEKVESLEVLRGQQATLEEKIAQNLITIEELSKEKDRLNDNCETQSEEVNMLRSEKEWLMSRLKEGEEKIVVRENELKLAEEKVVSLENQLTEIGQQQAHVLEAMQREITQANEQIREKDQETAERCEMLEEKFKETVMKFDKVNGLVAIIKEEKTSLEARIECLLAEIKTTAEENNLLLSEQEKEFEREKFELTEQLNSVKLDLERNVGELEETRQQLESVSKSAEEKAQEYEQEKSAITEQLNALKIDLERKIDELEQTKQQLKTVMESAGDAAVHLQRDRDSLNSELEMQKQSVHSLTNEVSTLKMTIQELEFHIQEKDEMIAACDDLKSQLTVKAEKITELEEMLESAAGHEQEMAALSEAHWELQLNLKGQLETLQSVQHENTDLRTQLKSVQELLAEKEVEIGQLQDKISNLSHDHEQRLSVDSEMRERMLKLEEEIAQHQEDICIKNEKIESVLKQMQDLEQVIESNSQELIAAKTELETMSAKNAEMERVFAETGSKEQLIVSLQAEKDQLRTEMETLANEKAAVDSQLNAIGDQLRDLEKKKQELEQVIAVKSEELTNAKDSMDQMVAKNATLEASLADAESQKAEVMKTAQDLEAIKHQLELASAKNADLETALAQAGSETNSDLVNAKQELERALAKNVDLEAALVETGSQKQELLVTLQAEKEQLRSEISLLKHDSERFIEAHKDQMQKLTDKTTQELNKASHEIDRLMARIAELEKSSAETGSQKHVLIQELQAEKETLLAQITSLTAENNTASSRYEEAGKKLHELETQKLELTNKLASAGAEMEQLRRSMEAHLAQSSLLQEKCEELQTKHGLAKTRLEQLEKEVAAREQQLNGAKLSAQNHDQQLIKTHEEEVNKLQSHIKKLRSELSEYQTKKEPRKMRRSSTFDTNRHLIGQDMNVSTQTDPVSQLCQCEALSEKVNQLKQSNMVKDLQMVELREAEKRSPLNIENYALKKRLVAFKESEARHAKEMEAMEQRMYQAVKQAKVCKVCDNRPKIYSVSCQTMPDLNLEKIADLKRELTVHGNKYEEVKRVAVLQNNRIAELEKELAKQEKGVENNPNLINTPAQAEYDTLRGKYELVKKIVEKRYHRIIQMEKDMEALRSQKTCTNCKSRLNTLQVP